MGSTKWSVIQVTQGFLAGQLLGWRLVPCLVVLLVAVTYSWQCVFQTDVFEMDALIISSFTSGVYTTGYLFNRIFF